MGNTQGITETEFRIFTVTKLSEREEKSDNQVQEMRQSLRDLKEEIHKEIDALKKNQTEPLR